MGRCRRAFIRGTVDDLPIEVEVHHESTGLVTTEEVHVSDVPVSGYHEHHPGTYLDPPESDSQVDLDLTHKSVMPLVEAAVASLDLGLCTILSSPRDLLSQLHELAEEHVLDNLDRYLDEGDCD